MKNEAILKSNPASFHYGNELYTGPQSSQVAGKESEMRVICYTYKCTCCCC